MHQQASKHDFRLRASICYLCVMNKILLSLASLLILACSDNCASENHNQWKASSNASAIIRMEDQTSKDSVAYSRTHLECKCDSCTIETSYINDYCDITALLEYRQSNDTLYFRYGEITAKSDSTCNSRHKFNAIVADWESVHHISFNEQVDSISSAFYKCDGVLKAYYPMRESITLPKLQPLTNVRGFSSNMKIIH